MDDAKRRRMTLPQQLGAFNEQAEGYAVRRITTQDARPFILELHYAHRMPTVSHAFGLFLSGGLVGVVTYGRPSTPALIRGICGDEWSARVLELSRLVLADNRRYEAGRLVSASLLLLPRPSVVVSFADTAQGHEGIVYQATNALYTGLSAKRTDTVVKGLEHVHPRSWTRGVGHSDVAGRFGTENVTRVERSRKHRYVYLVGSKTDKKRMRAALKYKVLPYPTKAGGDRND